MSTELTPRDLTAPDVLLGTGLGSGFLPKAPGTWGTVLAVLLWIPIATLPLLWQLLIIVAYFFIGWWCSTRISARYGLDDAGQIVADEIVGMWLALVWLPDVWWIWIIAFALFRLLDIAKPGPIGWLDKQVKGGLGVMLDDLVAGGLAGGVLYLSIWVFYSL